METNEIKEKKDGKRKHRLVVVIGLAILLYGVFAINQALQPQEEKPRIVLEPGQTAGERKVVTTNGVEFAFRWCPAGWFLMGSSNEKGREPDEEQHYVMLTKGFWIMETEVTQKQWEAIMRNNPSHFEDDDLPVEQVSWNDCQEFCKKCVEYGVPLKLPTEAQWEYACRAGTTGKYAGDLDEMAWYDGNETHPVGTKKPNPWGLYDMHGNVWEWCQDWKVDYPDENATDPTGAPTGSFHVFRGSCYSGDLKGCRSANREGLHSSYRASDVGFRCVLEP